MKNEKAIFGAGCFWHVEESFRKLKGVKKTCVGFMGGNVKNPSYKQICNRTTGHIEVCQVEFDSKQITYEKLLDVFWEIHDPTQENRQGFDIGSQYSSTIFYFNEKQKKSAEDSLKNEQKKLGQKIATKILKTKEFYKAEEYHQKYLMKTGKKVS